MRYFKDDQGVVYAYDDDQIKGGIVSPGFVEMTPGELEEFLNPKLTDDQIAALYDLKLSELFQETAVSMGYESWQTCALRAYRSGPFEEEGTAFFKWMESCNVKGYEVLEAVKSGRRKLPSIEDFISEMPKFVRPSKSKDSGSEA